MCYFRKEIKEGIKFIPGLKRSEVRMWIKLSANFFGLDMDVYLSHIRITQNVLLGHIVLMGDLNARTGIL